MNYYEEESEENLDYIFLKKGKLIYKGKVENIQNKEEKEFGDSKKSKREFQKLENNIIDNVAYKNASPRNVVNDDK